MLPLLFKVIFAWMHEYSGAVSQFCSLSGDAESCLNVKLPACGNAIADLYRVTNVWVYVMQLAHVQDVEI